VPARARRSAVAQGEFYQSDSEDLNLHTYAGAGFAGDVAAELAKGVYVDAVGDRGKTPLMYASCGGREEMCLEVVDVLLAAGANLRARDSRGDTAVHTAAVYNHVRTLRVLLGSGAEVNARNHDGKTPLAVARERRGCGEAAAMLEDAGGVP
jgi:uncharacterized protein